MSAHIKKTWWYSSVLHVIHSSVYVPSICFNSHVRRRVLVSKGWFGGGFTGFSFDCFAQGTVAWRCFGRAFFLHRLRLHRWNHFGRASPYGPPLTIYYPFIQERSCRMKEKKKEAQNIKLVTCKFHKTLRWDSSTSSISRFICLLKCC